MELHTADFALNVEGIKGTCPAGERYANEQLARQSIPVLSCEGPCIRGDIARLAANMVAAEAPGLARACHAEAFFVPHSAMNRWVTTAVRSVMIDGCFLQCHGRVLRNLVASGQVIHFDAFRIHRQYADVFSMEDVPQADREAAARKVADAVLAQLRKDVAGAVGLSAASTTSPTGS
jgi:uncharacterized metal-binding protein